MSELIFHFGVMAAGKSEALLEQVETFEHFIPDNFNILCVPFIGGIEIESRNGKRRDIDYWLSKESIDSVIYNLENIPEELNVFVDEAQFLDPDVVVRIREWLSSTDKNVTVYCYGLLTNYLGEMFSGSATLLSLSDHVYKLEKKCDVCDNNAVMNSRKIEGNGIIDLNKDKYIATCYKCWKEMNG